jgi:hypothetical protein
MSNQTPDYTVEQMLQAHLPDDGKWHDFVIRSRRKGNTVEISYLSVPDNENIHTIPVPDGWSIEQSWEVIKRGDRIPPDIPVVWANIIEKEGRLIRIVEENG